MGKRVILVFFLLHIIYVLSSPHLLTKREIFCGRKLTDTLALVCEGKYNSPSKKSMNDLLTYSEYEDLSLPEDDQLDFPFLEKEVANSFLPMRFRRRHGIVDECCRKPCTLKHMSLYCA